MLPALTAAWSEVRWWLAHGVHFVRRRPGHAAVLVATVWLCRPLTPGWAMAVTVAVVAAARVWAVFAPVASHRWLVGPVQRVVRRRRFRRGWRTVAVSCGLGVDARSRHPDGSARTRPVTHTPRLARVTADGPRVHLRVRPMMGQDLTDFEKAAERLRMAFGATRIRVEPSGANEVLVTFTLGDSLAAPFDAAVPDDGSTLKRNRVRVGRLEDGESWWLPVGPHTLVAGCSGAGKGSVFWSFVFGLAPGVRAGRVRLHGIDLKGGMEIMMGSPLFTRQATDAASAVVLMEALVEEMQDRTRKYAGRVRSHVPTLEEPLHVVMVDELAALTAYLPDRDLRRRAEMAINLLCSQGRAPGFMVFACLQDPRKEVIPSRGLFTQMVGLRLKDATETAIVLGETAATSGAHCHRISPDTPGVGYVVPEDGGYPIRVRAGYASDRAVRAVAADYATPTTEQVVVPEDFDRNHFGEVRRPKAPERGAA